MKRLEFAFPVVLSTIHSLLSHARAMSQSDGGVCCPLSGDVPSSSRAALPRRWCYTYRPLPSGGAIAEWLLCPARSPAADQSLSRRCTATVLPDKGGAPVLHRAVTAANAPAAEK
ncbi:hypothetical protein MRX96_012206 [Rhipicephalus microplus]